MYKPNPRQYFKTVEEIYEKRFNALLAVANRHVYNKDLSVDAVHDAFAKAIEYFNKNPERKVREQIMIWLVLKACKRLNKHSKEIPFGDTRTYSDARASAADSDTGNSDGE